MKKRLFALCLAVLTALLLAAFTGCNFGDGGNGDSGGGGGESKDYSRIEKSIWQSDISSKNFHLWAQDNYSALEEGELIGVDYDGNVCRYTVATDEDRFGGMRTVEYFKSERDGTVKYVKKDIIFRETIALGDYTRDDNFLYNETEIDVEEYNEKVVSFKELIEYIATHYDSFTYGKTQNTAGYTCPVETIENATTNVKTLNLKSVKVWNYVGEMSNTSPVRIDLDTENRSFQITFDSTEYAEFMGVIYGLKNYTIKGGPSVTDPDYAENSFSENSVRIHFPNREDVTQKDAYFKTNAITGKCIAYRQTDGVNWTVMTTPYDTYYNARETTLKMYMGFLDKLLRFEKTKNGYERSGIISLTMGAYTYSYYDIKINVDSKNAITSGNWKMKLSQGDMESAEYKIEIVALGAELQMPEIHTDHEYETNLSYNGNYHWHDCKTDNCVEIKDVEEHEFTYDGIVREAHGYNSGEKKFVCSKCGYEKTEYYYNVFKTTVDTAEEWNSGTNYAASENVCVVFRDSDSASFGYTADYRKDSGKVLIYEFDDEWLNHEYYEKVGDSYYKYVKEKGSFVKTEIAEKSYNDTVFDYFDFSNNFRYEDFKDGYDKIDECYRLSEYTLNDEKITNVRLYFRDGKLVQIYYVNAEGTERGYYIGTEEGFDIPYNP